MNSRQSECISNLLRTPATLFLDRFKPHFYTSYIYAISLITIIFVKNLRVMSLKDVKKKCKDVFVRALIK